MPLSKEPEQNIAATIRPQDFQAVTGKGVSEQGGDVNSHPWKQKQCSGTGLPDGALGEQQRMPFRESGKTRHVCSSKTAWPD